MDNSDKIKLKHLLMMATSNYGVGLFTMDTSKRLSYLCQALDLAGKSFGEYKERVLKSLYTNNKRKIKGIPMRRRVLLKKWMLSNNYIRALK